MPEEGSNPAANGSDRPAAIIGILNGDRAGTAHADSIVFKMQFRIRSVVSLFLAGLLALQSAGAQQPA